MDQTGKESEADLEWTAALITHVPLIDAQHRELIHRINAMLTACRDGKGREELEAIVRYLEAYVLERFATEERETTARRFPGYADHKARHNQ